MPRKKGVAKIATVVNLVPQAKLALEWMAADRNRPANHLLEDLILERAAALGRTPTTEQVEAWLETQRKQPSPRVPTPETRDE
jgi:hypothetical protein